MTQEIVNRIKDLELIASAKSRSLREASHQPGYIASCLLVTHVYPAYLVEERYFRVIF